MDAAIKIAVEFWSTFEAMAPYLLFGFLIAGILSVIISPGTIERHLGGSHFGSVIKASLFGVPLPLCSCSVIPVTASLRKHGAGRGAATAFLLSTPQTGVDSIMVTYALLGPAMAIFRPIAAFITGIAGGVIANLAGEDTDKPADSGNLAGDDSCGTEAKPKQSIIVRALRHGLVTLPQDVGKSMLIGVMIAAAITAFVPDDLLAKYLGGGILSLLAMMLFGIPVYVCATASVPIAAALIMKGVSPGAALVFLMTGPATNAAGIASVWKMMGARTVAVYLTATAVSALAAGLIFDSFLQVNADVLHEAHAEALPPLLRTALSIALIIILLAPSIPWPRRQASTCCCSHD